MAAMTALDGSDLVRSSSSPALDGGMAASSHSDGTHTTGSRSDLHAAVSPGARGAPMSVSHIKARPVMIASTHSAPGPTKSVPGEWAPRDVTPARHGIVLRFTSIAEAAFQTWRARQHMRRLPSAAAGAAVLTTASVVAGALTDGDSGAAVGDGALWLGGGAAIALSALAVVAVIVLPRLEARNAAALAAVLRVAEGAFTSIAAVLLTVGALCAGLGAAAASWPLLGLLALLELEATAAYAAIAVWATAYGVAVGAPLLPDEAVAESAEALALWPVCVGVGAVAVAYVCDLRRRETWMAMESAAVSADEAARAAAANAAFGDSFRGGEMPTPSSLLSRTPLQQAISQLQRLSRHMKVASERRAIDDVLAVLMHNPDLLVIDYEHALQGLERGGGDSRTMDERTRAWVTTELQARRVHSNPRINIGHTLRERRASQRRVVGPTTFDPPPPMTATPTKSRSDAGDGSGEEDAKASVGMTTPPRAPRSVGAAGGTASNSSGALTNASGMTVRSSGMMSAASSAHTLTRDELARLDVSSVRTAGTMPRLSSPLRPSVPSSTTPARPMRLDVHDHGSVYGSVSIPTPIISRGTAQVLANVGDWDFDVFGLATLTGNKPLTPLAMVLFNERLSLLEPCKVDVDVLTTYLQTVEAEYCYDPDDRNPYHTNVHAADVTQAAGHFLTVSKVEDSVGTDEAFALLLAAVVHDFRHPGVSSNFLIATHHELSVRYNDQSVLENFHAAEAFALMRRPGLDVLGRMDDEQKKHMRFTVIQCVLATDLAQGQRYYASFKARTSGDDFGSDDNDMLLLLQMALKCADVGHPARPLPLHEKWSNLISREFHMQGDKERVLGLPISPLCDRDNFDLAKSQQGFIEFVVRPCFEPFSAFCGVTTWNEHITHNRKHWSEVHKHEAKAAAERDASRHPGRVSPPDDAADAADAAV
uniref:PDEase domain-containing protein n=1 Tax=Bicosoecida sp. CB-2014 TaxID=1486930 RepID=A0A7S1C4N6_9STRA|mmetsp:Transcript_13618/g.47464  ORF Transcript_13618/g.47464 Transcript_13618/m.47464 type:complete len:935 (+) Transcript_13618:222-3026(+)